MNFYLHNIFPCLWTGLVTFGILYWVLFRWIGLKDKKMICYACCALFWYGAVCLEKYSNKSLEIDKAYRNAVSEMPKD